MGLGTFAFADTVGAIGVGHDRELSAVLDQAVDQGFGALVVTVVVSGTVDDQQFVLQVLSIRDGRVDLIDLWVLIR